MPKSKEKPVLDLAPYREEKGEGEYDLWVGRVENTLSWLKDKYWNGFNSWHASYMLDRAIHWAETSIPGQVNYKTEQSQSRVTIPLIATHIRNLLPFLAYNEPNFYGRPHRGEDVLNINAQVDYLNYQWRQKKLSRQAKKALLDAAIIGHGIAKVGWTPEDNQPTIRDKGVIEYNSYIKPNSPFTYRVNPFLFVFDRTASLYDLYSARWCCEIILKPVHTIFNNPSYDKTVVNKIKRGQVDLLFYKDFTKQFISDEDDLFSPIDSEEKDDIAVDKQAVFYEIWDKKFKKYYLIPAGQTEYALKDEVWPYEYLTTFPHEMVLFEEVPNDLFGIGHVRYLKDLTAQINRNRSSIFDISSRFSPIYKYYTQEGNISSNNRKVLREHPTGGVLELDPRKSEEVKPLELPRVPEDNWRIASLISSDWREISGDDILAQGGPLPSRTSAEEIRERRRLRGLRLETSVQNAHEFYLCIGNKILEHARNNIDTEMAVSVVGKPGRYWNKISPDVFSIEQYTLDLGVISKPPDPPDVRRQDLMSIFQMMLNPNFLQIAQQYQIPLPIAYLFRLLLESMEIPELAPLMPDIDEIILGPEFQVQNTGYQLNPQASNATVESQRDGVQPTSSQQGVQGILSQLPNLGNGGQQ